MPIRQKLKDFWSSVTSELRFVSPTPSAEQPLTSSQVPTAIQVNATGSGEQPSFSSPTRLLTRTIGRVNPPEQPNESTSRQVPPQSASPNAVAAPIMLAKASTPPPQNVSKDGWGSLKAFVRLMHHSAGVLGPLRAAAEELLGCVEIYDRVGNNRDEFKALQAKLEYIFKDLQLHLSRDAPPTVTVSMESLCRSIIKELGNVKGMQDNGTIRRYLDAGEDAERVLACYRRIEEHLQRLLLNANLSIWMIVDEQATDARLDRLNPSFAACYNSRQAKELKRGACTPNTRVDVLGHMYGWVHDRAAGSIYWLNGMAGTGKTTIAYSLCEELKGTHNLGASFFCSRLLPECRDVNQVVPSIAYQLARFSRPFRAALSQVLEKDPDVYTQLLEIQFEMLILQPLGEVRDTLPEDLVVVIDALDECENKRSTGQILEALLTKTSDLPIKFFISSRPEPEIRDQMTMQGSRHDISRLVLHELDKGVVQGDIETYLRAALGRIKPLEAQIATLVQRAGILFIYAATVIRYIGHDNFGKNPRNRLNNVLNIASAVGNSPYKDIDELYALILNAAIDDPDLDNEERDDMKQVLNTVLCAQEPLTISVLAGLLGLHDVERVHSALRPLWSVLHVVESSKLVTTLHASFPDYMFDPMRSKSHHCNSAAHEQTLARCCFNRIKNAKPQFNICGLESSYERDDQVANLSTRIEKAISPELPYACRYWATHLKHSQTSSDLVELLDDFLSARLLLWMEIMNLKKCMDAGVGVILQAEDWCIRKGHSKELSQLAHDAWKFVAAFTSSSVSQSTPHIYVSMLPFWPESSPIASHYAKYMQVSTVPQGSAIARRRLELLTTWSVGGAVSVVTWSPDSTQIAVVAGGQIFFQDAVTGRIVIGPLQHNSSRVLSIDYSPDGTRVVAGSEDGMIGIWDVQTGTLVLGPLKGHTGEVNTVIFSPDSTRIASGSSDMTVRMWDAQSGQAVLHPLKGHTGAIASIAFSPDSARIISGSNDATIRMWSAKSGRVVLGPLKGHTHSITSVAFAPNGAQFISGSNDRTIRIWDARKGQPLFRPLDDHTEPITSVAFSPDGTHIVSGSNGATIGMWDVENGWMVLRPLEGHTQSVTSVAFSPDRTRIASGSWDETLRMWDARSRQTVSHPPKGHAASVTSVAFSPDGTHILSGSHDETICMWDARSGRTVSPPLKCYTPLVSSVSFSPTGNRIISSSYHRPTDTKAVRQGYGEPPCKNYTRSVNSVAFSPRGTCIVSGSDDATVRMWEIRGGLRVLGLLNGHTKPVTSVAFSPDGIYVVSGSDDKTVYVWNAQSKQTVLGPLKGHTESVASVAFSPDGSHIVSGSRDKTIRIWDARGGQMVLPPLRGHTESVTSVAFSPDGSLIVSGSNDNTIYMWDAQSGQTVLGPLRGHTGHITSIAFSPNGSCIASGSNDDTIRMWDAQSGQTVLGPLKGHTGHVTSVGFSSDGTRIVSASDDNTIRVWDVQTKFTMAPSSSSDISLPWKINADGWVTDHEDESRLLIWVPSDLHPFLLPPRNILSISTEESVGLNFLDTRIGESWANCQQPI